MNFEHAGDGPNEQSTDWRQILDGLRPVNREGSWLLSGRNKMSLLPRVKFLIQHLGHIPPVLRIGEVWEKIKLKESGRQRLGTCRLVNSPVSRRSMQSYILTYYRLRNQKLFDSPGLPPVVEGGGDLNYCVRGTHHGFESSMVLMLCDPFSWQSTLITFEISVL